jgi:hypothetical protein
MLKDRRELVEYEIKKLADECGSMYLQLITGNDPAGIQRKVYESKLARLTNMTTELGVISKMIANGHP